MDNLDFNFFCTSCTKDTEYRKANCFTKYRVRHLKEGEYVTYKGAQAKELSIVVKGRVDTQLVLDYGLVFTSHSHCAPYPIGAIALFSYSNTYRADIMAVEDCDIISINKEQVELHISNCPTFMRNFIAYTTEKIDLFTNHINVLTHKNLKARLSFYIFSVAKDGCFHFDIKLDALAAYLCVERPSLSRAIAQMVADGIITYKRGVGQIKKADELKKMLV